MPAIKTVNIIVSALLAAVGALAERATHSDATLIDRPFSRPFMARSSSAKPWCVKQEYTSSAGDTCSLIETEFALDGGSVFALNSRVDCNNISEGTNLFICVPQLRSQTCMCTQGTTTDSDTTCAAVGAEYGISAAWIKARNPFVDCTNIWEGTKLCIANCE